MPYPAHHGNNKFVIIIKTISCNQLSPPNLVANIALHGQRKFYFKLSQVLKIRGPGRAQKSGSTVKASPYSDLPKWIVCHQGSEASDLYSVN